MACSGLGRRLGREHRCWWSRLMYAQGEKIGQEPEGDDDPPDVGHDVVKAEHGVAQELCQGVGIVPVDSSRTNPPRSAG